MACQLKNKGGGSINANGVYILKRFISEPIGDWQMTPAQACGAIANLECEAHFNPSNKTWDPDTKENGAYSYGIFQWRAGMGEEMKKWVSARNGGSWQSLQYQVDFLMHSDAKEMVTRRKRWTDWCKAHPNSTPSEAGYKWSHDIEVACGAGCNASNVKQKRHEEAVRRGKIADKWADWLKNNSIGECNINVEPSSSTNNANEANNRDVNCVTGGVNSDITDALSQFNDAMTTTETPTEASRTPTKISFSNVLVISSFGDNVSYFKKQFLEKISVFDYLDFLWTVGSGNNESKQISNSIDSLLKSGVKTPFVLIMTDNVEWLMDLLSKWGWLKKFQNYRDTNTDKTDDIHFHVNVLIPKELYDRRPFYPNALRTYSKGHTWFKLWTKPGIANDVGKWVTGVKEMFKV